MIKKIIEFFSNKKPSTIIAIVIGALICLIVFFGLIEYTFGFFERIFTFYTKATFGLLVAAFIITSKICNRNEEPVAENVQLKNNIELYAQISEVLFFILRENAAEFSAVPPRDVADIQVSDTMLIEKYNIRFFQFRCEKSDISNSYSNAELDQIRSRMQRKLDLDVKNGRFPSVDINSVFIIDTVSDYTYNFGIQVVVPDENYYRYKQLLDVRKKTYGRIEKTSERWDDD